jgi:hypothetical protein
MNGCSSMRVRFSEYLDGRLTGVEMQRISAHLRECNDCTRDWQRLRGAQSALTSLGSVPVPRDLLLRIRVAVSQEKARSNRSSLGNFRVSWDNTVGPFLLQAAAGFASAVLLIGTVAVLVGIVAQPQVAHAGDEPLGRVEAPRFLYSIDGTGDNQLAQLPAPVTVEAYVNTTGQVYDFRIVSGPDDAGTRAQVANLLLGSVFEPAKFFGQPVRGLAVLSFSGVAVRG